MDDRLAKLLLENNLMQRQQSDERRLSLLEKLATDGLSFEPTPIPGVLPPQNWIPFWKDDFVSGSDVSGSIGELGWQSGGDIFISNLLAGTGEINHPGYLRITTTLNTSSFLRLAPIVESSSSINPEMLDTTTFIFRCEAMGSGDGYLFGLSKNQFFPAGIIPAVIQEGIYFYIDDSYPNWQTVTSPGGTQEDTGVPFSVLFPWIFFQIKRTPANYFEFYINQQKVSTHSANITTNPLTPTAGLVTGSGAGSIAFEFDYFDLKLLPIIQRWD